MTLDRDVASLIVDPEIDHTASRRIYDSERHKRLRSDGIRQYEPVAGPFSGYGNDPYVEPGFERDSITTSVEIAIIGAGLGGLIVGASLRKAGFEDIRLIEWGGDVGGTWYWNRFPGAQSDIESYIYLPFLEELGYIPRHKYSYAPEIFEHLRRIAYRYSLYDDALFQTRVTGVRWHEPAEEWMIVTDRDDQFAARFVIFANGPLSKPQLPGIPGIREFDGHTFHTSRWDYRYTGGDASGCLHNLNDKHVGLIGTGATAIQVVPHLADSARHLYVFQRTPSFVAPRNNRETDRAWSDSLPVGWQKRRIENFTTVASGLEVDEDLVDDGWTDITRAITRYAARGVERKLGRSLSAAEIHEIVEISDIHKGEQLRGRIDEIVKDPTTANALKPWYYMYCKRPCFHDDYLESFNRPNVTLVDTSGEGVEGLSHHSVLAGGQHYPVDCLIFATGFEVSTSYMSQIGFDPVGCAGVPLSERWLSGPRTLHGMQTYGFPNCFLMGVIQNAATPNFTHTLTEQATHISYILREARSRSFRIVEATRDAEDAWLREMSKYATDHERERWGRCTPGYFTAEGDVGNANGFFFRRYGGGAVRFFQLLQRWRDDDQMEGLLLRGGAGR